MDRQASTTKGDLECMLFDESMKAKALPLSLLSRVTDGFSYDREIGRGAFGVVYKGLLENGAAVAVKKLHQTLEFDEKKFNGEVCCLMKANHKNIVRLLGYCSDTQGQIGEHDGKLVMADVRQRLLCFEYVPKGSLDKYIEDASREWRKCYQIIKGVCEGLHYLHRERIVHSDLKPTNILLDNDMVPKITDFGISRCFDEKQTHEFTSNVIGTLGYFAPELLHDRKISFKSDIHSLGVIINQILAGEKEVSPIEDVLERWRHKVEESQKEQQLEQIRVCTELGKRCTEYEAAKRPSAQEIIDTLEGKEIKRQCIETGASSSTVPHPGSLVENKNKSTMRVLTAEDFMGRNTHAHALTPQVETRTIKEVRQAICQFYGPDRINVSFKDVYSDAYNMVLYKKGEELYSAMETAVTSEVQNLCRPLNAAPVDGVLFLEELLTKWNQHIRAIHLTCGILMYMEKVFVPLNHKTPIVKLGLRLWRDQMDRIRPRLTEVVKRQRGGKDKLVAGVNKMLSEVGAEVMDEQENSV